MPRIVPVHASRLKKVVKKASFTVPIRINTKLCPHPKTQELLELHRKRLITRMPLLAAAFKFKVPHEILLRPLYTRNPLCMIAGRYIWDPDAGFTIALNIEHCLLSRDKGFWVMDHEMSHIAAGIRFDEWKHGPDFETIYKFCRKGCGNGKETTSVKTALPRAIRGGSTHKSAGIVRSNRERSWVFR
ncbi:MAG: hypothetical protein HZA17_11520 [Nitrospirae bacterium]|nr:hypothetical protein [Nitrospirota bacterium]